MTIQQFIEKAIEGGWMPQYPPRWWDNGIAEIHASWSRVRATFYRKDGSVGTKGWYIADRLDILLDPLAWKAVGKVEGWWDNPPEYVWRTNMHRMIDALAEGKTIEQFISTL